MRTRSPRASCSSAVRRISNPDGLTCARIREYHEGSDIVEMLKEDLIAERIAIDTYREIIQYLGNNDPTYAPHARSHPRQGGRARRGH